MNLMIFWNYNQKLYNKKISIEYIFLLRFIMYFFRTLFIIIFFSTLAICEVKNLDCCDENAFYKHKVKVNNIEIIDESYELHLNLGSKKVNLSQDKGGIGSFFYIFNTLNNDFYTIDGHIQEDGNSIVNVNNGVLDRKKIKPFSYFSKEQSTIAIYTGRTSANGLYTTGDLYIVDTQTKKYEHHKIKNNKFPKFKENNFITTKVKQDLSSYEKLYSLDNHNVFKHRNKLRFFSKDKKVELYNKNICDKGRSSKVTKCKEHILVQCEDESKVMDLKFEKMLSELYINYKDDLYCYDEENIVLYEKGQKNLKLIDIYDDVIRANISNFEFSKEKRVDEVSIKVEDNLIFFNAFKSFSNLTSHILEVKKKDYKYEIKKIKEKKLIHKTPELNINEFIIKDSKAYISGARVDLKTDKYVNYFLVWNYKENKIEYDKIFVNKEDIYKDKDLKKYPFDLKRKIDIKNSKNKDEFFDIREYKKVKDFLVLKSDFITVLNLKDFKSKNFKDYRDISYLKKSDKFIALGKNKLFILDARSFEVEEEILLDNKIFKTGYSYPKSLKVINDENILLKLLNDRTVLYSLKHKRVKKVFDDFSFDNYVINDKTYALSMKSSIEVYDLEKGKIKSISKVRLGEYFSKEFLEQKGLSSYMTLRTSFVNQYKNRLLIFYPEIKSLYVYKKSSGIFTLEKKISFKNFEAKKEVQIKAFLPNKGLLVLGNEQRKLFYDLDKFEVREDIKDEFEVEVVLEEDKVVLYNLFSDEKIFDLWINKNTSFAVTPEGFFRGVNNFEDYVFFVKNKKEVISLNQLYDLFYRPDLVLLKYLGKDISKYTKNINFETALLNPPSSVKFISVDNKGITSKEIETNKSSVDLEFEIVGKDKETGLINIYHEGKLVKTIGKGSIKKDIANAHSLEQEDKINSEVKLAQVDFINKLKSKSVDSLNDENFVEKIKSKNILNKKKFYSIKLDLISGLNNIEVEVYNKTNTVSSIRHKLQIQSNAKTKEANLYAIVLGVNEFESKNVQNLNYSINDTKAIKDIIEKQEGKKYKEVKVKYLVKNEFTKQNLKEAIEEFNQKAKLEDSLVFYASSHGKAFRGDLLLVPYNNLNFKNWISFDEVFKLLQENKALKQIFVLDTCESGKASDVVSLVYDSKASSLAKKSGVHMLLSTSKGTYSFEHKDPKIKNGVFTYNILQSLKDNSSDKNSDGFISVIELSDKLKQRSLKYQYPIIKNIGSDTEIKSID